MNRNDRESWRFMALIGVADWFPLVKISRFDGGYSDFGGQVF